jgi:predicted TPR repeat methyltransferase
MSNSTALRKQAMSYIQSSRFPEAKALYAEICRSSPGDAEAWFMLCAINGHLGLFDEAIRCGREAVAISPQYVDAHYNLGQAYMHQRKLEEAAASYREVVRLNPAHADAWNNLGNALHDLRKRDEAIACYREALRLRPDFTGTHYRLAALGGAPMPEKPPVEYVVRLFDKYADNFEQQLVQELEYQTPELLNGLVRRHVAATAASLNVLDLGCGTGLCGPLLRDLARTLVGVDISAGMIAKARAKNAYDKLLVGDIAALDRSWNGNVDLVVAADVFPYVGDLKPAFEACRVVLRTGGHFAFSTEALEQGESYLLRATDRYAHSADYVRQVSAAAGFAEIEMERVVLRKDRGKPVDGYIFLVSKSSD